MINPNYEKIHRHLGHKIEVVGYGCVDINCVAVECIDCHEVIELASPEIEKIQLTRRTLRLRK